MKLPEYSHDLFQCWESPSLYEGLVRPGKHAENIHGPWHHWIAMGFSWGFMVSHTVRPTASRHFFRTELWLTQGKTLGPLGLWFGSSWDQNLGKIWGSSHMLPPNSLPKIGQGHSQNNLRCNCTEKGTLQWNRRTTWNPRHH